MDLKSEIEKGWSGATSDLNVKDIINDKKKELNLIMHLNILPTIPKG